MNSEINKGRIVTAKCHARIRVRSQAIWTVTTGHTGRTVKGGDAYVLADEWEKSDNMEELLSHPGNDEFQTFITEVPVISDFPLRLLRGRCVDKEPLSSKMGPPPLGIDIDGGRYNKDGESILYLGYTEDGLIRELDNYCSDTKPLYVQKYNINDDDLCIADLTSIPEDHFIAAVFDRAESCNVAGRGSDNYRFSQHIGALVAQHFDGIIVPGVRGEPGSHYRNVVMFNPHPDWSNWLAKEMKPYVLNKK